MSLLKRRLVAIMIALNQLGSAIIGGNPQESSSSRLGNARNGGSKVAAVVCWLLEQVDFHDPARLDHCDAAVLQHIERLRENLEAAEEK